mmetsp:Transcript_36305/g.79274  ORF Transcript_36305/g.79274 Transcript_36305/m.79274 type:complete len:319 (+) Transcript_36305:54-1010(+)|eukprot:CAMPEP_0204276518 /NCGR_PEP_ID=MMETSP0468-20130131/28263_1 /ASSEMBLY_ACC=CAM_ASM_000383 /TAXON_ID=2969 /ORGANISM="Oxyrrhis marina" /LENGTH=318 /DNA_ID=CAMNT_0051253145 /DNA_START=46 /DNA_END=1002 /DNA_ORIENTATION=+
MAATMCATLNTGAKMPLLGLGTWQSKPGEVQTAVGHALKVGYRHIDAAFIYLNENEVGDGLQAGFASGIKREEVFVTSKLWNTRHSAEAVKPALMESLQALKLEYLDLYLIHWPVSFVLNAEKQHMPQNEDGSVQYANVPFEETWREMEKLVDEGLVKAIGISNFNSKQVDEVMSFARIPPAVNQVECHPYLQQEELLEHCRKHNIVLTAYSPLGGPERPWAKEGEPTLLDDPKIKEVADKFGKTNAHVCVRFQIQRGIVVIPKSVTPSRIEDNMKVFDFELSEDDMNVVRGFHNGFRGCIPPSFDKSNPFYPFNIPF